MNPLSGLLELARKNPKKSLVSREFSPMYLLAKIARACGRVSVGGDPDKRPVNRQKKPAAGANR
jgi:hypothetical protein